MIKNKRNKLTLRRETLTALEMQAAQGGAGSIVAATAHSICNICYQYPVIPRTEWPQTSVYSG